LANAIAGAREGRTVAPVPSFPSTGNLKVPLMDAFMQEDVPGEPPPAVSPVGFRAWQVSDRHGEVVADLDPDPSGEDRV
jgi:hypothetical protein